ncbi:DM13 domain-containing protein [Nostoc sp. FACHB-110]|uniref:DM13 domain-containing protein n=1 Tax=Nostoc sp. FACHB-110 TaxID=2692834 RepID=UPI001682CE63|nr:DM13 domain-containing protein [Nostoc sp. FACHB-110]MBD2436777.1 DM13 domain-containing protein [Nostoc sp. FACHB-110]
MQGKLLVLGLTALAIVGCTQPVATQQQPTENPISQDVQSVQTTETATESVTVIKSGSFVKGEHTTKGNVRIITKNSKNFLELDQDFNTSNGPDVLVILYRKVKPPIYGITEKEYVSLGHLKKTSGSQSYEISHKIKIADFPTVAVWCRQFNATFGYAALTQ